MDPIMVQIPLHGNHYMIVIFKISNLLKKSFQKLSYKNYWAN
jgi:hypothetical protein